jgi:hypothetical protein
MASLTEQIRNAPRRRVPDLPHWWGFFGGLALVLLLLLLAVSTLSDRTPTTEPITSVPPPMPGSGYVVVPTEDGQFFGLPPEAVTVAQDALRGRFTGDFGRAQILEGLDQPEPYPIDFDALGLTRDEIIELITISNPVGMLVVEMGAVYRLAFEVDVDGPAGPRPEFAMEVTVVYAPQGWRWFPDEELDLE